ncbi:deoxyguanosinetriphosphate triphosphohydrolase [Penaeicola halotolerans]|uniref:deoxyguanosinetriphosphate triphosphohydrolase n=1 Tax=Penaeicola halotolerans TaxID=2793196 RepID=UPI001CF8278F|nr:deoxyguanosinetriphosphate triphosphohydrolase [Penaeicola halotolerans]
MKKMNWLQLLSPERIDPANLSAEPSVISNVRSAFEQDYDRIIFSPAFRFLQDKTQVFPLPEEGFVHNRLTHSLEVSSVGRSLGKKVGEVLIKKYPELSQAGISHFDFGAVVAAASLTHDIGNPPFGHSGESAISDFFKHSDIGQTIKPLVNASEWADLINFEGNAQGFRVLLKPANGTKLTLTSLATFTKYPRPALCQQLIAGRKSQKKYGFYASDAPYFAHIASRLGLIPLSDETWCRHPLTFLVEAADDICYHIIDLEDGCALNLVSFDETLSLLSPILGDKLDIQKLHSYATNQEKLAILRAMTINQLIEECTTVFLSHEEDILTGDFDRALTALIPSAVAMKQIQQISIEKIYQSKSVLEKEAAGFEVIEGLLQTFVQAILHQHQQSDRLNTRDRNVLKLMSPPNGFTDRSLYEQIRIVLDFISGMTDKHALSLFRTVKGIGF